MDKKVIIIGAGLTGLSAGIHLQQSGINTEIFEISGQAGGMCTAWERSGFRFDGCIHWMVGTKADNDFYKLYREVNALADNTPIYNAELIKTEINGVMYEIPLRFKPFQEFLLSLSAEDDQRIKELCSNIETMMETEMPTGVPTNVSGFISLLRDSRGFMKLSRKYLQITVGEYVEKFTGPLLKSVLYTLMPPRYSLFALFMMLGTRMSGNAGYPMGGASGVIQRMEERYLSLGGKINFNSKVDKIIVETGKVVGVITKGEVRKAAAVIAACDMYDTLKNMLDGKYKHKQLDTMLESAELFQPITLVSFGLNRCFKLQFSETFECNEGIRSTPNLIENRISLRSFEFDPSSAPENCSSVMVMMNSELEYWQNLRNNNLTEYRIKKQQLAEEVADRIDKRIPGFKEAIKVTDVATPATYIRYANLYKASWEGFAPTPAAIKTNFSKTIDGVKGLYLSGQWTTAGGGICTAVKSGKDAAKSVLKAI